MERGRRLYRASAAQKDIRSASSAASDRKRDCHRRALADPALDAQHTMMELHDGFDNRQPQAGAAEFARAGAVNPIEALRQARNVRGRNSLPGVRDDHLEGGLAVAIVTV